jgi:hypothetical protein
MRLQVNEPHWESELDFHPSQPITFESFIEEFLTFDPRKVYHQLCAANKLALSSRKIKKKTRTTGSLSLQAHDKDRWQLTSLDKTSLQHCLFIKPGTILNCRLSLTLALPFQSCLTYVLFADDYKNVRPNI